MFTLESEKRPKQKDVMRRIVATALRMLAMLYVGLAVYAWFFSESQIFLPHGTFYRDNSETVKLKSSNGHQISAIYLVNPAARFTLLVSHGNAEDLGDDREWLEDLHQSGFSVLAYDYQGYGTSEGKPSEQGSYDDEEAAYNYLIGDRHTPAERIIIFGKSVGAGPAVHLAARKPAAALILQSPFLSAFRVLTRIPLLPFDRFPNLRDIRQVRCPLLVIHGTADSVIPFWHGQKLFTAATGPKTLVAIPGADHNDLGQIAGPRYLDALRSFASGIRE
jgi:fermentation-respiration switch protein FrsA (DUF1100 family)